MSFLRRSAKIEKSDFSVYEWMISWIVNKFCVDILIGQFDNNNNLICRKFYFIYHSRNLPIVAIKGFASEFITMNGPVLNLFWRFHIYCWFRIYFSCQKIRWNFPMSSFLPLKRNFKKCSCRSGRSMKMSPLIRRL